MKHNARNLKLLLTTIFLAACGEAMPGDEPQIPVMDNDPPLTTPDSLKADAPKADQIPFEGKADTILPKAFDIVSLQTPVRNQAKRGVCSIFSTVGLMESLYKKAGMANPDFSEQYLQWSVKSQVRAFTSTEGSSDYYNLQAINRYGIPVESAWPYEQAPWTEANDPACKGSGDGLPTKCYTNGEPLPAMKAATKYKLPAGRWVSTT